jgi:hypothetical protein
MPSFRRSARSSGSPLSGIGCAATGAEVERRARGGVLVGGRLERLEQFVGVGFQLLAGGPDQALGLCGGETLLGRDLEPQSVRLELGARFSAASARSASFCASVLSRSSNSCSFVAKRLGVGLGPASAARLLLPELDRFGRLGCSALPARRSPLRGRRSCCGCLVSHRGCSFGIPSPRGWKSLGPVDGLCGTAAVVVRLEVGGLGAVDGAAAGEHLAEVAALAAEDARPYPGVVGRRRASGSWSRPA